MADGIAEQVDALIGRVMRAAPQLLPHRLLLEFEPVKESFRVRPASVGATTRVLRSTPPDAVSVFASAKGRDAFLLAASRYLCSMSDHEELIVAFGRRHGPNRNSPSRLEGVRRGVGGRSQVSLTPTITAIIDRYLATPQGQVLIVHNHPPNDVKGLLSLILGWWPLPSDQDRE